MPLAAIVHQQVCRLAYRSQEALGSPSEMLCCDHSFAGDRWRSGAALSYGHLAAAKDGLRDAGSIRCLVFLGCCRYCLQEHCHGYTGGPRAASPRRSPCHSSSTPTSTAGLQRLSRSQPHEVSVHCNRVSHHGSAPSESNCCLAL